MHKFKFCFYTFFIFCLGLLNAQKMNLAPSSTVTDKYFGINIVDEYRNLENLKDSSVVNWMREQTKYSTNTLKSISNRQYYTEI